MKKPGDFNPEEDSHHIHDLIRQGEGESLDFKFEISDARKIARTLVAFANTSGGTLLIGVKDNGAIAGIRSDEEYYMLDAAATMYCRPPITFTAKLHNIEGRMVLEAIIPKSDDLLHTAPDKEGNYKVFVRKKDENLLPGGIFIRLHQLRIKGEGVTIGYTDRERFLLHYLLEHDHITLNQYKQKAGLSKKMAENILIRFILLEVIAMDITEEGHIFRLCDERLSREILEGSR